MRRTCAWVFGHLLLVGEGLQTLPLFGPVCGRAVKLGVI